ncbi:hypothetical protein BH09BAC5_BH09BAC5_28980 [soil metagenome]
MRIIIFLISLVFLSSCSGTSNNHVPASDSISAKDSLKKAMQEDLPDPSDIKQFNWFYSAFVHSATTGDDSLFNILIHPKYGLWVIHSEGALPAFTKIKSILDYKNADGSKLLPFKREPMLSMPKEEELPVVNCDNKNFYSKSGCFTTLENVFLEQKIWKSAGLAADQDKLIEESAATISRTVINTEMYRFYFSLINGTWYLTFIDVRKPCNA